MKYAWLLALPYVVAIDKRPPCGKDPFLIQVANCGEKTYWVKNVYFYKDKEMAEDFAAALNEAHSRRESPPKDLYWKDCPSCNQTSDMAPKGFDFQKACKGSCTEDK